MSRGRVMPGVSTDEWWTPLHLIDPLGPFNLDPCAPVAAPGRTGCRRWWTSDDDGLSRPWEGRVWCNPPYRDAGRWMARLADHGDGIGLVFARVETGWWHEHVWPRASGLLFIRGRVSFIRGEASQQAGHNAAAPSVLVAYGEHNWSALLASGIDGHLVPLAVDQ